MKAFSIITVFGSILFLLITGTLTLAEYKPSGVATTDYPYSPSLLQWEKSNADFTSPETCADCHPEKVEEWSYSMHAMAFKDPIYQGELNQAVKKAGHDVSRQCEGCHSPAAVVKGEIKGAGLKGLSPMALAGVSCDVCHSVKGHTHWQTPSRQPENGSLVLSPGKDTPEGPVLTKYGPLEPYDGCGDDFHECVKSDLHKSAELCAGCHQVFNYQSHTPLEETWAEWRKSPYAVNDIHCQDCHMVQTATFIRSADTLVRPESGEYFHFFNGANFLIYSMLETAGKKSGNDAMAANAHEKYTMSVARLQAAADLEIIPRYTGEWLTEFAVRVKNIRAGHRLPTSLTNIRQVWLEITAVDAKGKTLMSTGTINAEGELPESIRMINTDTQDSKFNPSIHPWEAQTFSRHDTILPKGYRDFYYGIHVRKGNPITLKVKLRYRQASQKVMENFFASLPEDIQLEATYGIKTIPDLPVIDMVDKTIVINQ